MPSPEIVFCETPDDVADAAAALIFEDQTAAIESRGVYRIALSGGRTPELLFERLASEEWQNTMGWENWEVFWADERAVPPEDPQSNFYLAQKHLLSKVPIGEVFRMPGEAADLPEAAANYARTLKHRLGHGLPQFDTVLLGMGPDGHTASLFPGHPALESPAIVEAVEVDQPVRRRLTLTLPVLNHALHIIFLVSGSGKATRVHQIFEEGNTGLPAARVLPPDGICTWLLDSEAAALLR